MGASYGLERSENGTSVYKVLVGILSAIFLIGGTLWAQNVHEQIKELKASDAAAQQSAMQIAQMVGAIDAKLEVLMSEYMMRITNGRNR